VSASQLQPAPASRESAHRKIAEGHRLIAEGHAELAMLGPEGGGLSGPRLVSSARDSEELLTIEQAAQLLQVDRTTVHRLARRAPRVKRYVGRLIRYERGELLRACRRGA
jgi:predicted DNA-binding transcriptional regulator AlpA